MDIRYLLKYTTPFGFSESRYCDYSEIQKFIQRGLIYPWDYKLQIWYGSVYSFVYHITDFNYSRYLSHYRCGYDK